MQVENTCPHSHFNYGQPRNFVKHVIQDNTDPELIIQNLVMLERLHIWMTPLKTIEFNAVMKTNILIWNCQGAGQLKFHKFLKGYLREFDLGLVVLVETRISGSKADKDLGYKGSKFTWNKGLIFERLDRALCNYQWDVKFPCTAVYHLQKVMYNHRPLAIKFGNEGPKLNRPFRYFIKKWSRETYGHVIAKKRRILARLQGIQKALERFYFKKSDKFIHMRIRFPDLVDDFCFTAVFESPQRIRRKDLWVGLNHITESIQSPWLIAGDFNVMLNADEKKGGQVGTLKVPFVQSVCQ
ncbi:hypothetical protein GOBAR_AA13325 [Gossypium barbadense]|uniref:Endonuclease/exonuclease/phosphatase domain-containing protein n=1 Tax=Gossypium barbadense TaxID=3634 RepID=A0A2P5XVF9_GOSBA|nr:hypothetical protein GOBAR_AA13325 [Gossypium barbadense]